MQAEFDIPVGLNTIETHYFKIRNVPTFYYQSAGLKGLDTSQIKNILASKGLIQGAFQEEDYDFISRISIYAVSQIDPNLKREMYYLDQVPLTTDQELRMLSSSTELKRILSEEFIDLEVRMNFRNFPGPNLRTKIVFGYAVF
ncbi:MAG: hypothetical protein IPO92_01855 [Saprospiraceae bacterium]|nr:hypothetical protein [Saprospiraceae bacterium]